MNPALAFTIIAGNGGPGDNFPAQPAAGRPPANEVFVMMFTPRTTPDAKAQPTVRAAGAQPPGSGDRLDCSQSTQDRTTQTTAADIDCAEAAFIDDIAAARDPARLLGLAGVPLTAECGDGNMLTLLRIETGMMTEIGRLTVENEAGGHQYRALPAEDVTRRCRLTLVYHDGVRLVPLTLAEARALAPDSVDL